MSTGITHIAIENYRTLANVAIDTRALNVIFGPNGAGKSSFLDTIGFLRDCAIRGVEEASSDRSHGIGMLWDGANPAAKIAITIATERVSYRIILGFSSGRIEPFVGEYLQSLTTNQTLIRRGIGSDKADFYHAGASEPVSVTLREPVKLSLARYLDGEDSSREALEMDQLLRFVHFYHARMADLSRLRTLGSDSDRHPWLWERGQNLWSALRNLRDRSSLDDRYTTIMSYMRQAFPEFRDLLIEQTGPTTVYGSFIERGLRSPIRASGVSDGHLQMLIHLTALFGEGRDRPSLISLDEPETSLHPHAIAVLARAVEAATQQWQKQIFIATHSPVLISQFPADAVLVAEVDPNGQTVLRRLSEIAEVQDLLDDYAAGSLYMAQLLAAQAPPKEPSA